MPVEMNASLSAEQQAAYLEVLERLKTANLESEAANSVLAACIPLLSAASNLKVTASVESPDEASAAKTVDAPALADAELKGGTPDLEALLAMLQIENDEKQLEVAKERIDSLKGGFEAEHAETMEKVAESINESEELAKKQKTMGIIGKIVGAIVLVISTVASFLTGGLAAGVAALVIGVVATAALAVMQKTGLNDKLAEGLAVALAHMPGFRHLDEDTLQTIAKVVVGLSELVLALVVMIKCPGKLANSKLGVALNNSKAGVKLAALTGAAAVGKAATAGTKAVQEIAVAGNEAKAAEAVGTVTKEAESAEVLEAAPKGNAPSQGKPQAEGKGKNAEGADDGMTELDDLNADGTKQAGTGEKAGAKAGDEVNPDAEAIKVEEKQKKFQSRVNDVTIGSFMVAGGVGTASDVIIADAQYDAQIAQSDVLEAQAYLQEFQARIDDEDETINEIIEMMNTHLAELADVLESQSECNVKITSHIGG